MAEAGRDLTDTLFGASTATAAPVDQWRQRLRLDDLEQQYNLPSGLMTSVLRQESGGDPRVKSSAGAQGLFQFMPKTAAAYKIDPFDPQQAAPAAAKELSTLYRKYHGDVDRTLAAWNWGQGNVDRKGMANMPRETRGFLAHVKRFISPAVAEAATPIGGRDLSGTLGQASSGSGRDLTDMLFGAPTPTVPTEASTSQPAPVTSPQTATAPTTQPGASQGPQTPSPDPSATPGMRFQALPSITQLDLADRMQKTKLFESLKPEAQEEFLRSEEPATGGLAMGGGPVAQSQPVTDPAALLAVGGGRAQPAAPQPQTPTAPAPMTVQGQVGAMGPLEPRAAQAIQGRVHEQGIPLSAVPAIGVNAALTGGGAFAGSFLGPLGSAAGAALGGSAATRINTKLGLTGQEKPLLETPVANLYPSDLLGAIPLGIAGATSALKGTVRNLPGSNVAKHEIAGERLGELGKRLGPEVPSDVLWQKAGQSNTAIATADVWRTAGDVVRRKSRTPNLSADDPALKAAQDLLSLAKKHGGPVPIQELDDARRNLVPHLRDPDVKRLYGAVIGDMDNAVTRGVPGAADLRGAIAATRKEHSLAELTDLWSEGKGIQKTSGDVTQVYGKRIQTQFDKKMQGDKTFAGAFTPEELVDVRSTLKDVGKLTKITNPEAQGTIGSTLKWLGRLGGAGYGATSGDLLTGGMMILATEGASAVMANAMQSKVGRWALREAIREGNGQLTRGSLAAIASLVAREAAPAAPAPQQTP